MTADGLRDVLMRRLEKPYEKQNDYYAWKKPDGTWFMLGMESYQTGHILKYEFDPFFKDYGTKLYSIDPHVTHRRGPQKYDPLQELISQVEKFEYLGHWRDPEIFMDDGRGGRVAACGRFIEAKARIEESLVHKVEQPSLDMQISNAERNTASNSRSFSKSFDEPSL